ncbi:MAG: hypothetical protein V8Q92_14100 [Coprococcus comes]
MKKQESAVDEREVQIISRSVFSSESILECSEIINEPLKKAGMSAAEAEERTEYLLNKVECQKQIWINPV